METNRNYWKLLHIVQGLGSVNPYSYPCHHTQPRDLWCQRQSDVMDDYYRSPKCQNHVDPVPVPLR